MDRRVRRATALDVARAAGVSQSAVSRVFGDGSASKAMTERVRAAADALGYRPDAMARGLITGRSRIVGLVVAHLENPFFATAIERLSRALQAMDHHLMVFTTGNRAGPDHDAAIRSMMDYRIDALVAASVNLSGDLVARCEAMGVPVVLFNRATDGALPAVTSDNLGGAAAVADLLVGTGHRRIAHVAGWRGSSTGRERADGFREALEAAGVGLHAEVAGDYDRATAAAAARALMEGADPPDAIFAGNDHMALAVLDELRHVMGLGVPEDVSVVGFDDVAMAAWPAYRLTTVRQDVDAMVAACVEGVMARIAGRRMAPRTCVPAPLVIRDTVRGTA
ncbi:LacI family DNA-binding transcriptional regulator [Jannaschia sp. Os4]|uniref:LacI family DNA-binding transcriptional regulator n=1 Tax=Jannaschia sp. Os4 TaxID=2807617 RepID=UPI00193AB262|nr:LacI family DNA-binding transcriptional regulator [Jannaschia sp. Os4]MBM2577353.1 LacI family DNA-binding transcriptional regulator [Jannaschia sp. Os4]